MKTIYLYSVSTFAKYRVDQPFFVRLAGILRQGVEIRFLQMLWRMATSDNAESHSSLLHSSAVISQWLSPHKKVALIESYSN